MAAQASTRVVNGINTRVLHGKDYIEVAERIRIAHEVDESFEQEETMQFNIGDRWFVRCVIRVKGKRYIGTAELKFDAPKNTPDGTNPMECAETSALGRALAFAGLGTLESIASYEEVIRGKPFTKVIEQGQNNNVVEAGNAPKQLPAAKQASERLNALAVKGQQKGLWNSQSGLFAFFTATLGVNVSRETVYQLSDEQLSQVEQAVEQEKAVPVLPTGK